MKVTYNEKDKLLKIEITEEIDHHSSEKIRTRADFEIQKYIPKKLVMDFENSFLSNFKGIFKISNENGKLVLSNDEMKIFFK